MGNYECARTARIAAWWPWLSVLLWPVEAWLTAFAFVALLPVFVETALRPVSVKAALLSVAVEASLWLSFAAAVVTTALILVSVTEPSRHVHEGVWGYSPLQAFR